MTIKLLILLNLEPEHTRLANIFCDKLGSTHKAFLLHIESMMTEEKALVQLSELQPNRVTFFTAQVFYFKERLTNSGYSDLSMWQIFSQK